eukprot:CAMPEP_0202444974 /NCGR_PEP_ID=MMETSP1360-20130828/3876_1 /ASSEMBLY_ACC=CAM_ASM_000848 /TAXON_ID=515479 /ORGANISM="Licmophora paradoxa, Strain CCMP2313" /LENGTH=267 /DNA_ID=CAMNT_0049061083 /DNA_START=431 /DNA_END=1230 /DNA_ORIENTATION=-
MAPEVLAQTGHGFCVDYWGLGMLVYEMMTGLPPWYTTDRAKLFRRLKSAPLDIPSYFSSSATGVASQLLERNPTRRLGVTGIRTAMEHDFFRSINWRALYARRVEAPIRPCEGWKPPEPDTPTNQQQNGTLSSSSPFASSPSFSQGPGGESSTGANALGNDALDAATANFDNTFTRMPVDTEDHHAADTNGAAGDANLHDELHEHTFVGFTFDMENKDAPQQPAGKPSGAVKTTPSRNRTHHYNSQQQQHSASASASASSLQTPPPP